MTAAAEPGGERNVHQSNRARRHALVHNAISEALTEAGDWVPLSVRRRATDAALVEIDAWHGAAAHPPAAGEPGPSGGPTGSPAGLRGRVAAAIDRALESFDPDETEDAYLAERIADAVLAVVEPEEDDEAHDAEHTWYTEMHDPLADEWVPGTRYTDRDRAVAALDHANAIGPTWRDGTPVQRRLVRATTAYTVEQPPPLTP